MESLLFNIFSLFNAPTTGPLKRLFHNDHEKTIVVWLQRIAGCLVRRNNVLRDVRRVLKIKLDSTLDIKKRCPDYILLDNSAQSKQKISTHRSYFHTPLTAALPLTRFAARSAPISTPRGHEGPVSKDQAECQYWGVILITPFL